MHSDTHTYLFHNHCDTSLFRKNIALVATKPFIIKICNFNTLFQHYTFNNEECTTLPNLSIMHSQFHTKCPSCPYQLPHVNSPFSNMTTLFVFFFLISSIANHTRIVKFPFLLVFYLSYLCAKSFGYNLCKTEEARTHTHIYTIFNYANLYSQKNLNNRNSGRKVIKKEKIKSER